MSTDSRRTGREAVVGYLFLSPWLIGMLLLTIGPMLYSATSYDLLSAPKWIGLDNFDRMFTADPRFRSSVRVTLIYVAVSVPLLLIVSMALALDEAGQGTAFGGQDTRLPGFLDRGTTAGLAMGARATTGTARAGSAAPSVL